MRTLELRRHTMRVVPGRHLSQPGVTLARRVGESMGTFMQVITSEVPRAFETALAMGYAVDGQYPELNTTNDAVEAEVSYPASPAQYGEAVRAGGAAAEKAEAVAGFLKKIAKSLPDDASALLISHGGVVELAAVGCFPDGDHSAWGAPFGYCEGVRLGFDGEKFVKIEILRVEERS